MSGFFDYMLTKNRSSKSDFQFGIYLIIATIPAVVIALLFDDWIASQFKDIHVIAVTLVITGLALWFIRNLKGWKKDRDITLKEVVVYEHYEKWKINLFFLVLFRCRGFCFLASMMFHLQKDLKLTSKR
ncbi:undecaprenyl-diphosphate phosphatase [Halalkalibacter lacteus]|uniref:undecaprenyl-diphosphate phosphatase n=1 Tax=Halalkalibacter lacteus TaxID=3090663 RepID=UPI002FC73055